MKEWLETQDTYTRYNPIVRRHKSQKTYVKELADQIQLDLVDMGKYKQKNRGYYWILTAVEVPSRYTFAIPVYRKDTKQMTDSVEKLLEKFKPNLNPDIEAEQEVRELEQKKDFLREYLNISVDESDGTNLAKFLKHTQQRVGKTGKIIGLRWKGKDMSSSQ